MERVSRHSTFWSISLVSIGRAITTIFLPEVVMFSFPMVFAYIGGWHQDSRYLRGMGGLLTREKYESTSNVPFAAMVSGKQSLDSFRDEIKTSNAVLALSLSLLFTIRKFLSRVR